jgi:KaiC/GvpD/RAD55 family RecA-like ATPase
VTISSRVSTGIRGLDDLMGGGFQTGKTYLVSGEAGTGKSIFCMQYILDGLSNGGRTGCDPDYRRKPST